eukprot:9830119-Alexandrium_andersonii.AAC.1
MTSGARPLLDPQPAERPLVYDGDSPARQEDSVGQCDLPKAPPAQYDSVDRRRRGNEAVDAIMLQEHAAPES